MISPRAISSIEGVFEKSLLENANTPHQGELRKLMPEVLHAPGRPQSHLVVLGVSSYLFRIVTLFDFPADAATAAYFGERAGAGQHLEGGALHDACGEFVNMVCGSANRNLQTVFPHSGISTPIVLESACAKYLDALDPTHRQSYEVKIDDALNFHLTLCVCVASGSTLDFHIDLQTAENDSAGELELF